MPMSASVGRKLTVKWNAIALKGVREKSVKMNGEAINVTDGDDSGWQQLLADPAENSLSITVSGVTKDHVLKADFLAGTRTRALEVAWVTDGTKISANFFLQSYSESGPYKDAITFEAEFVSAGAITYTPGA